MPDHTIDQTITRFNDRGMSRRQLMVQMTAMLAAGVGYGAVAARAQPNNLFQAAGTSGPTFHATDLNHIALNVTDVQRSRAWYEKHLGLKVVRDGGEQSCFLTTGRGWVALFQNDQPGLHHYCYSIDDYDPAAVVDRLKAADLSPTRRGNRVYFDDLDGIENQLAQQRDSDRDREDRSSDSNATFHAVDLNHIALRVRDVDRSQQWYQQHLGLEPMGQNGFLTTGRGWLALFRGETPGLHHYCYSIDDYDPAAVVDRLKAAGLSPRRRGNRVYFDDPDGIECQLAQTNG